MSYTHQEKDIINKMDKDYGKSFCVKAFTEIATSSNGNLKLCCFSDQVGPNNRVYYSDKFDNVFYNNEELVSIRKAMLEGKPIRECRNCYVEEESGVISPRQEHNFLFYESNKVLFDDIVKNNKSKIKTIDLKFGNKCNYACIMCDPSSSSLHSKEIEKNPIPEIVSEVTNNKLKPTYFDFPDEKMIELLDISSEITRVKSTGGEPFLLEGFKDYIKKLVDKGYSKNIEFHTVSNGTIDCTDLLPYFNEFKKFVLRWSVDGTDEVYNFIRYPGNFNRMTRIHKRTSEAIIDNGYKNIHITLDPTAQLFNLHNLIDILKYGDSLGAVKDVTFGYIYRDPKYLDTALMPIEMLEDIFNEYDNQISSIKVKNNYSTLKELIFRKHNEYTQEQKQVYFKMTEVMIKYWKKVRNLDVYDHIPTYSKLKKYYT